MRTNHTTPARQCKTVRGTAAARAADREAIDVSQAAARGAALATAPAFAHRAILCCAPLRLLADARAERERV
jgi:hypothetical protein